MFGEAVEISIIDVHTHEGVARMREVRPKLERQAPVPSVIINERLAFGGVPDLDELTEAIKQAMQAMEEA
jgi:hypothetical protein